MENDGISDLLDALPSYDPFEVREDTRREFELTVPDTSAAQINGRRAFLATRILNTLTNYNPMLQLANGPRDLIGATDIFFQAQPGDREYVRFQMLQSDAGEPLVSVQFSPALANACERPSSRQTGSATTTAAIVGPSSSCARSTPRPASGIA